MPDIHLKHIVPRGGSRDAAFEELCCQVARHSHRDDPSFVRLRGAGGDGGVECYVTLPNGRKRGWQAKYIFDFGRFLREAGKSLGTAVERHPDLEHYTLCCPFDLTGPTGRTGRSQVEKYEQWRTEQQSLVGSSGRIFRIDLWTESELRDLLLRFDSSGGLRGYFFDHQALPDGWCEQHLDTAIKIAGPRYTADLTVDTPVGKWFEALTRGREWTASLTKLVETFEEPLARISRALDQGSGNRLTSGWPNELQPMGRAVIERIRTVIRSTRSWCDDGSSRDDMDTAVKELRLVEGLLAETEDCLAELLEKQHGRGAASSAGFRQFQMEYELSFPTANLDLVREIREAVHRALEWLMSPEGFLAFERVFLLTGDAGVGKTHSICDVAQAGLRQGKYSIVLYGDQFGGEPDVWGRIGARLGLSPSLSRDALLDLLDSAAEQSGSPLLIFVDALNETRPFSYWRTHLAELAQGVSGRDHLRLCVSCRSSYLDIVIPDGLAVERVEHPGFRGNESAACRSFFGHYGLVPPVAPFLTPEFANPLYLRLLCEALKSEGLARLPSGWRGVRTVIDRFLADKERRFAQEHSTIQAAKPVRRALGAILKELAGRSLSGMTWSRAKELLDNTVPEARGFQLLEWLCRESLLRIEGGPCQQGPLVDAENLLHPAFERLADHLLAERLLSQVDPDALEAAVLPSGPLYHVLETLDAIRQYAGLLGALSIQFPETVGCGRELASLLPPGPPRALLVRISVNNLPWRDPTLLQDSSRELIEEAFQSNGAERAVFNLLLQLSCQPSPVDATWLDSILRRRPLARRDEFWCPYLHMEYEDHGPVRQLIESAYQIEPALLPADVSIRWATSLAWICAAADRRVRDEASRALVEITAHQPGVWPTLLEQLLTCDDEYVSERVLVCAYGALLLSRNRDSVRRCADTVYTALFEDSTRLQNAMLRDHGRCILELAAHLDVFPEAAELSSVLPPYRSEWPLSLPDDAQLDQWKSLPKLAHSCLDDDFFTYTLGCLGRFEHGFDRQKMGRWILQHVARDLGYAASSCVRYDQIILARYGPGRSRKMWADRIGKKYQWIALWRLAARLGDNLESASDSGSPEPLSPPLVLAEERQFDPTLTRELSARDEGAACWWIQSRADFSRHASLPDEVWVTRRDDLPSIPQLLGPFAYADRRWLLLEAYPTWWTRDPGGRRDAPYRQVWVQVRGYIVSRAQAEAAFSRLVGKNLFGGWMPEGANFLHGFAGEYPFATPFNIEPEWYLSRGGHSAISTGLYPVSNQLVGEWEYDASVPRNFHLQVPSRKLFESSELVWNGMNGFKDKTGRTVMLDPSLTECGAQALVASRDDLLQRLEQLDFQLIWTILGEKLASMDMHGTQFARRTFSQVCMLDTTGEIRASRQRFFSKYR